MFMEDNNIKIDPTDPVDIIVSVDQDVENMVDDIKDHDSDYPILYDGVEESASDDFYYADSEEDTYYTIDDNSLDFLDMEADEEIESYEDDDGDGELIDMTIQGICLD